MTAIDTGDLPDTTGLPVVGPDHWRYAQVKDWLLLCGDIPHVDIRVYGVFRSLAAQAMHGRRLSKDEVRWLVPGVNGKAMSMRTLEESLRRLAAMRLVVAEQGNVNTRATRNRQGKWERVETLLWRVNELPEEGLAYQGWHTVQEGLDAYPGPGWVDRVPVRPTVDTPADDPAPPDADAPARRARKTANGRTRSDQRKRRNTAGGTARGATRKSAEPARKSADRARKSSDDTPSDLPEPETPNLFTNLFTDQPPQGPPDAPDTGRADDGQGGQAGGTPPPDAKTLERAARLLADFAVPAGASPPTRQQATALVDLVCALWDTGASNSEIRETATRGTDDVRYAGAVWIKRLTERLTYRQSRPTRPVAAEPAPPGTSPPAPVPDDAPGRVAARQAVRGLRKVHRTPTPSTGRKKPA